MCTTYSFYHKNYTKIFVTIQYTFNIHFFFVKKGKSLYSSCNCLGYFTPTSRKYSISFFIIVFYKISIKLKLNLNPFKNIH